MLFEYIKKPTAFILVLITIVLAGFWSAYKLPIKMYPDLIKPSLRISYGDENISLSSDMYSTYGIHIEPYLKKIEHLENFKATYNNSSANYNLDFEWGADEEEILREIQKVLDPYKSSNDKFWYWSNKSSNQSSGFMTIFLASEKRDKTDLSEYINNTLKVRLDSIKDINNVWVGGRSTPKTMIVLDQLKILQKKIDPAVIKAKVSRIFSGTTLSTMETDNARIPIIIPQKSKTLDEALETIISIDVIKGQKILLKDIAHIESVYEPEERLARLNGVDGSFLFVSMKAESDVKRTCDEVIKQLDIFASEHSDIKFSVTVNPSTFIDNAIMNLILNAGFGGAIAILVIFFAMGSIRNTLIIAISIPFCLISSFLLMDIYDTTINLISLGGLAIGIGMIVDSSIVTLENIFRRLKEHKENLNEEMKAQIILNATKEVVVPILASVLTSIIVFFPILYTVSYSKAILGDLAKTIIFLLTISTFSSLFIVPGFSQRLMTLKSKHSGEEKDGFIKRGYLKILSWLLSKRRYSAIFILLLCTATASVFYLIPSIKKEIIANPNSDLVQFYLDLPDNENFNLAKNYTEKVEHWLGERPEVIGHFTSAWSASNIRVSAQLHDSKEYEKLSEDFKKAFDDTPEINYSTSYYNPGSMPVPQKRDLLIEISGTSSELIEQHSSLIAKTISSLKEFPRKSPSVSTETMIEIEYHNHIDFSEYPTNYIISSLKSGLRVGRYIEDGKEKDIYMSFEKNQLASNLDNLKQTPVPYKNKIVPLQALADIQLTTNKSLPLQFINDKQAHEISVTFKDSKNAEEKIKTIKEAIASVHAPDGTTVRYLPPNIEISNSIDSFTASLIASIILIFVVIAVIFNSVRYPLIILFTVPLALIGVIVGLWSFDSTISLNSMLGIILLAGLVVNNGILLIDFYIKRVQKDFKHTLDGLQAIKEAASLRFRPIIMTTLTTLFGVLPIALAFGDGGSILQPLGVAVFSGLLVSTLLTLFAIPCLIRLVDHWKLNLKNT